MDWLTQPIATLTAGLVVVFAAAITFISAALSRRQDQAHFTVSRAADRQDSLLDRYTTAASQLGNETSPAIRLAGVYALFALADDWISQGNRREGQMTVDLLRSYLRVRPPADQHGPGEAEVRKTILMELAERSSWWQDVTSARRDPKLQEILERGFSPNRNKQALGQRRSKWVARTLNWLRASFPFAVPGKPSLTVRTRPVSIGGRPRWEDLIDADLHHAYLKGLDLKNVKISGVSLVEANLQGVSLQLADLELADLSKAVLVEANLVHLYARAATFEFADLREADLHSANLNEAILDNANLAGADLRRTELRNTSLKNTNLTGANLEGHKTADLEAAGAVLNDPHWAERFSTCPFATPHTAAGRSKKISNEPDGTP